MAKLLSSPIVSASNNIVLFAKGTKNLPKVQKGLVQFNQFLQIKTVELERTKLPDKKKIKELANLNVVSTFGSAGGLLGRLASGALDVAGFLGNFFPSRGKLGKPKPVKGIKPPKPVVRGPKLKLGGIRALGVVNALFAGVDFATGLQEGESVGKAAAGAGGSLAGSLLGGAIGQALIPIPGVGFVLGSMAGGFLGGYASDRVYEGGSLLKEKLTGRLKKQQEKQKVLTGDKNSFSDVISKFSGAVSKFERGVASGLFGSVSNAGMGSSQEGTTEYGEYGNRNEIPSQTPGEMQDLNATGGTTPSSNPITGKYGEQRSGHIHAGVDYAPPAGTPISVIQPGSVSSAEFRDNGYGNQVKVDHPGGVSSFYAHLSSISVKVGQQVSPGTVIGKVGSTGHSTGPHLHFEVDVNGKRTNPTSYADKLFRFGGNVKVAPKASPQSSMVPGSQGIKQGKENVVIGDSIAKGQMDATGKKGKAVVGASPDKVMGYINEMNQNGRIKGNTVELSSGLANNVKDIGNVQKQLESLKSMGAASVLLSGTAKSGNRKDQIQANNELAALAAKYPGFVKFGGGFTPGADNVHPADAAAYNKQLTAMQAIVQPAPQAQVVPAAAPSVPQVQTYPTYNQPQSSVTVMPIMMRSQGGGGQQKPMIIPGGGGGGGTVILPGPSEGELVNSLMKTILLTNLSAT